MHRIRILVAALIVTVATILFIASPAQAGPTAENYVTINSYGDQIFSWFWVDKELGIIGCARCSYWFDFRKSEVLDERSETVVYAGVMDGLTELSQAAVTTDEKIAAGLREQAISAFTASASALGKTTLLAGPVGYYVPAKGATVETGDAWLSAADQNIADGIALLQISLADPDPNPWVVAATAKFDLAYRQISTKQVEV